MEFYGVGPKDLEGIVSQLRVTEGVEVAVFMYELRQNEFKVSLRSKREGRCQQDCTVFWRRWS